MGDVKQPDGNGTNAEQRADDEAVFPDLKVGDAWGESITKVRAAQLEAKLHAWEQEVDHGRRKGPFDVGTFTTAEIFAGVHVEHFPLTGADVFWLAVRALAGTNGMQAVAGLKKHQLAATDVEVYFEDPQLNLSGLNLTGAALLGVDLTRAYLHRANLSGTDLSSANLTHAYLVEANLTGAWLPNAILTRAYLNRADLTRANMKYTMLIEAHLERATFTDAILEGANLARAILEGANLTGATLDRATLTGAILEEANLTGAELTGATFDNTTDLTAAQLTDMPSWFTALVRRVRRHPTRGPVNVADLHWNGADLTVVDWSSLRRLGDERPNLRRRLVAYQRLWWWRTREESERAARANTQLAKRLRDAGMNDDADRFAYRAQVCQRGVHLLRGHFGRWLFSWLLFVVAGYGYRPLRTLFWYLAVIGSFAFAFYLATHGLLTFGLAPSQIKPPFHWYEALVLSVSSFHGRGFFQPVQSLGDPVAILAAAEAVFGLFIEISFIATFTQRYFGK